MSVCTQRWLWESSVYTALRVFTLIEQNEANEEQQQQNKKKFNASVGICFRVCVQTKRKNKKKYIVVACFYSHNMTYAHREGEREIHSSRLPQKFLLLIKIYYDTRKIFSNFPSSSHSLPILTTTSLSAVEMCGIIFFLLSLLLKFIDFFPPFFPLAVSN